MTPDGKPASAPPAEHTGPALNTLVDRFHRDFRFDEGLIGVR